jgi:hypothetical protein
LRVLRLRCALREKSVKHFSCEADAPAPCTDALMRDLPISNRAAHRNGRTA